MHIKLENCEYDLITEDDENAIDGNQHKEHSSKYLEELYQAHKWNTAYI